MLEFIPLDKGACERCVKLEGWIKSWLGQDSTLLKPSDWFELGQDVEGGEMNCHGLWCFRERHGKRIWAPPPGAADYALEQLRLARLKRVKSTLVFVCPRLLIPRWRRQLHRVADCVFECPAGATYWPTNLHEPLVFCVCFPFVNHRPWQLRQSPAILDVARRVQRMWKV